MVKCGLCGIDKPRECFSPDKRQRTGLQRWCKPCRCAKQKQHAAPKFARLREETARKRAEQLARSDKACSQCGTVKALDAFDPDTRMRRGRASRCKECLRQNCKAWRSRNIDKIRVEKVAKYAANRDAECARAMARYREYMADPARRASMRKRAREWLARDRESHRDEYNTQANAWRKANPEKMRIQWTKKRLRKLALPSDLTVAQWLEILEVHDSRCAYCLRKLTAPTKDHVIAINRGGIDTADNIVPACQSCNSRKSDRPVFSMVNTPIRFDSVA